MKLWDKPFYFSLLLSGPKMPWGYSGKYNIISKKNNVTYYTYKLKGFPNFPHFANFCIISRNRNEEIHIDLTKSLSKHDSTHIYINKCTGLEKGNKHHTYNNTNRLYDELLNRKT